MFDGALNSLHPMHPARRPNRELAKLAVDLGRDSRALAFAAYEQDWCDGPPYCRKLGLQECEELLLSVGAQSPDLPIVDPSTVVLPHEAQIRELIKTAAQRRSAT